MTNKIAFSGLLAVFSLFSPPISLAEPIPWPIKNFKVIEKIITQETELLEGVTIPEPTLDSLSNLQNYLTDEQEREIEKWLEQVANYFESLGFNAPRYETISSDGKYYEVHVFPFDGTARAKPDCDNPSLDTVIQINPLSDKIFTDGNLKTKGYQDLAHELFHTVQYSYPMFQGNCGQGAWITEGTAEAVGIETARKLLDKRPYTFCQIGLRPYSNQLYTYKEKVFFDVPCEFDRTYQTQSFWHYLGEYISNNGRPNPVIVKPPNYSYLHEFFNTKHNSANWKDEYDWLNRALRKEFGFDLSRAYPSFVGTFAAYWNKRLLLYPGNYPTDKDERKKKWHKYLFNGCSEIPLTQSTIPISLQINEMEPVSAECLDLEFQFTGQANFTIFAEGTGRNLLDLTITAEDGEKRVQPIVHPNEFQPERVSYKFSLPVKTADKKVFIISNIANEPQNSVKQQPLIKVVFDTATSSITDPDKAPPPDTTNQSGTKKAKTQIEQGYETQSWRVGASQGGGDSNPCQRHFVDRVCGPHTQISLTLMSDTANIFDEIANPGMLFERMMNVTGGMVERGEENVQKDVIEAIKKIQSKDGHSIEIKIPRINYGFTGSFDNALITAAQAYDGIGRAPAPYKSVGPVRVGGCEGIHSYVPYKGKVTIEEASRLVLRGTYSAELVDAAYVYKDCVPVLPVAKSITGTFSMPNPRLDDSEEQMQLSEDILDSVIQSTNEMMPGLVSEDMAAYIRNKSEQNENGDEQQQANQQSNSSRQNENGDEQQQANQQSNSSSGTVEEACNCICETAMATIYMQPYCYERCESVYKQCENYMEIAEFNELTRKPTSEEEQQIAELRLKFETLVKDRFSNPDLEQSIIDSFDKLPNLESKQQMHNSLTKNKN